MLILRILAAALICAAPVMGLNVSDIAAQAAPDIPGGTRAVFLGPTYSSPIAISRDDRLVWTVNPLDDTVSVLRTDKNKKLLTIDVGDEPRSVALDPNNNFAFVANAADGTVSVIEIVNDSFANFDAAEVNTINTGSEPWNAVISPNGKRLFVANSGDDTISVINALNSNLIGQIDLANSLCNDPDRRRHFQPRGLAVTEDNSILYVTRFLSFTKGNNGRQGTDKGKEGAVCRLDINTNSGQISDYQPVDLIRLRPRDTGFSIDSTGDGEPDKTFAFPNQLQSIVIRGGRAFLPNVAASPEGPLRFNTSTQAFVNIIKGVNGNDPFDAGALNLNLGARQPEAGKQRLFFANPWAIAFTNRSGAGNAYVASSGSDLLVKLNVAANGNLSFTMDGNTTRYIDLNDPLNPATSGVKAGKNPLGLVINSAGNRAYVTNFVSGNVSVVNLNQDNVIKTIPTAEPPTSGLGEGLAIGREMFFSSRGHFNRPIGTSVSTDNRLSVDAWQGCGSCHPNGLTDAVTWLFSSGPRKTIPLNGTFDPSDQRILNYSAVFDEVQDFELNIRDVSGPGALNNAIPCETPPPNKSRFNPNQGLIIGDNGDPNEPPCNIDPFIPSNGSRQQLFVHLPQLGTDIPALSALKEFTQFSIRTPNAPTNLSGADVAVGRTLFENQGCASCHGGSSWTQSIKDFASPPAGDRIACEVNLGGNAPAGSFCNTAPTSGSPVRSQYLFEFLEDIGSFNLGVPGQGNPIGGDIGAEEKAAATLNGGVSQPPKDALGMDYNGDGRGAGYTIPSLLGVHASPPYMHNGACETLFCVVSDVTHRTGNGQFTDILGSAADRRKLVIFLNSIDANSAVFP